MSLSQGGPRCASRAHCGLFFSRVAKVAGTAPLDTDSPRIWEVWAVRLMPKGPIPLASSDFCHHSFLPPSILAGSMRLARVARGVYESAGGLFCTHAPTRISWDPTCRSLSPPHSGLSNLPILSMGFSRK